jgi:hypothetical protein
MTTRDASRPEAQQLINQPHFRIAARRLGEAIAADLDSGALVREIEVIAMGRRSAERPLRVSALLN